MTYEMTCSSRIDTETYQFDAITSDTWDKIYAMVTEAVKHEGSIAVRRTDADPQEPSLDFWSWEGSLDNALSECRITDDGELDREDEELITAEYIKAEAEAVIKDLRDYVPYNIE